MGRITSFSKQVIVFFLVTALIIRPSFAANIGGWTLGNPIAQGASAIVNGTKTAVINGANVIKNSTAKITPPASAVAKVLARGAAGYALSVAVQQLLGSVDWVLDPANNRIKYYIDPVDSTYPLLYRINGYSEYTFPTKEAVCAAYVKAAYPNSNFTSSVVSGGPFGACTTPSSLVYLQAISNPAYDPDADREEKSIPLTTVAQKVISNAESGDPNAQVATTAAAADIIAEAEKDNVKARPIVNQLEANASTQTSEEAKANAKPKVDPETQLPEYDITLDFPAFCGWAPVVCQAAQVVITFPNTLTEWWETANEKADSWAASISEAWAKLKEEYYDQPQENTDTELEIPDLEQDIQVHTDISFGGSCPAPLSSDINFMGLNKTIEFSFDPVCQIAEFIKPVVISISAFSAALIVAGIRTEDD